MIIAAACAGLGVLGYGFWPREETHISDLLTELCTQLNQTRDEASLIRLQRFLNGKLQPGASVHLVELEQELLGRLDVVAHARDLLSGPPLTFSLSSIEVRVSGRLARADADLTVTASGSGEQRRELRRTRVRLAKLGDEWQIEAVEVDPIDPAQMEARP